MDARSPSYGFLRFGRGSKKNVGTQKGKATEETGGTKSLFFFSHFHSTLIHIPHNNINPTMTQSPSQTTTTDQHDPDWAPTARPHEPRRSTSSSSSKDSANPSSDQDEDDEDDEDEYDKRIARTGCSVENEALQMCYAETHDWRECKDAMQAFRDCWKRNGNVEAE